MKPEAFEDFFRELHGAQTDPFPWQKRLARQVCETNTWPRVIDLPTGSGKTACIDIALFHLLVAASSGRAGDAARRIAFVVDRRIIVDEAAQRAARISEAIQGAKDGILADAAGLLARLSGEAKVQVLTLRGGIPRERNLVRDPTAIAIVLSTVDQIGSRLLFRGYGVSDYAKPMHAGIFGFDTLLLLDEAHIAEPLRQTLTGVEREQARARSALEGVRPLRWSQLSATPSSSPDFSLDKEDRDHPRLARRLNAQKPMRLVEVARRDELPNKLVALVKAELSAPPQSNNETARIGIVLNRIITARDVQSALTHAFGDAASIHLLIGRTRPIDRDRLMAALTPALKSSEAPRPGERPIIVVATQTIEVGADFDFHSMFIEAASYPSIRQRIGRMNRLGARRSARGAVILVRSDAQQDPVYGSTIDTTWELLRKAATDSVIDLGITNAPAAIPGTAPPTPPIPELSPSLLQLLVQTNPRPAIEPDISAFLHGFTQERPDIAVVWREGIYEGDTIDEVKAARILDTLPPLALEAMSLPLTGLLSWLRDAGSKKAAKRVDAGDIEGDVTPDDEDDESDYDVNLLVIEGDEVKLLNPRNIRPGATVIVASDRGGADEYGFAPDSTANVTDLSLQARALAQRAAALVFTPSIVSSWALSAADRAELADSARQMIQRFAREEPLPSSARDIFFEWADSFSPLLRSEVVDLLNALRDRNAIEFLRDSEHTVFGLALRSRCPKAEDMSDDNIGLQRTVDVSLKDHCLGVASFADRFAQNLGLADPLRDDLRLSGRLHDLGKADPRFQAMLGADSSCLLAKGVAFERHVVLGARHECYSVAFVNQHPTLIASAHDPDLVRYLIGSHHGRGRSLHPVVEDIGASFELDFDGQKLGFSGQPNLDSVDSGWPELFAKLQRRYGAWGLAYLETILRLADHRCSEAEVAAALP